MPKDAEDRVKNARRVFKDNPLVQFYLDSCWNDRESLVNRARLYAAEEKFQMHAQRRKILQSVAGVRNREYV